jgi:ubiquitin carboxyl-terminal hydrolase 34
VGKSVNLFCCHECKKAKKIEDTFHSITLEVKNSKTLTDSFNRYILGELINDYTCDFCEKKVDVTKRTRIMKNPKVLIIHLQRIVFNLDTFINEKISTKHSFPHELNLYPYTLEYFDRTESGETDIPVNHDYDYNLIGIICHTGNAESGHYISYIKTENNKWY